MNKKILFLLLTINLLLSVLNTSFLEDQSSAKNKREKLTLILKKCADYCERLARATLNFVCQEKIQENIDYYKDAFYNDYYYNLITKTVRSSQKVNIFTYDYQLIKKGDSIKECRILLEENGQKKHEENALLKTERFFTERSGCAPIGFSVNTGRISTVIKS